jgi:hypothetical protein
MNLSHTNESNEEKFPEFDPLANIIEENSVDWAVLANDATILRAYGMPEYEAIEKVFDSFRYQFLARLRAELKARRTAQWKAETFERLKQDFEAKK